MQVYASSSNPFLYNFVQSIVHMLYRHNGVKTKGDGERENGRERERETDRQTDRQTHTGDIVCMNVTDR